MIKYGYSIDYPLGMKRVYIDWVRPIADTLQKPVELKRLASYDNEFSASPQRVVEFSFESLEDPATYFECAEMIRIFGAELPHHGTNVGITALRRLADYTKDTGGDQTSRLSRLGPPAPASVSPRGGSPLTMARNCVAMMLAAM